MFYNCIDFSFTQLLESQVEEIRSEVQRLNESDFIAWPEKFLCDRGWDFFKLFSDGKPVETHCALCPVTASLIGDIPGLTMAGFSSLAPHTQIRPHVGISHAVLRCHLGIQIPKDTGLRVGHEKRQWEEGRCLIFDDTEEHETWNQSNKTRIILWIEFLKKVPAQRPVRL